MSSRLKMLIVGAGLMGRTHLEAARDSDSVEYVGVVDINAKAAGNLAARYGLKAFVSLDEAVDELSPDAVDICAPTPQHLPLVEACASRGVHVLCEKPIALTMEEAEGIKKAGRESDIRIMIAQVIRFWPEYRHARRIILGKEYGQIRSVDCLRLSSPPNWNTWMLKRESSGGAVVDLQIHDMDFVFQILGKPDAVWASGRQQGGALNSVHSRLIYPSRTPVLVRASFLVPPSYPFRMYFSIVLDGAILEMDFWRPEGRKLKVFPQDGEAFCPEIDGQDAYRAEIEYFAGRIMSGEPFDMVPIDEPITSLQMCLASERSFQTGEPSLL